MREIRNRKLTYLSPGKLEGIITAIRAVHRKRLPGLFVEAGCALGGSTILIAKLKEPERTLKVYDVFDMIPPPSTCDTPDAHRRYETIRSGASRGIGGDRYYGYEAKLLDRVIGNIQSFGIECGRDNVRLIPGLLQHTMAIEDPVAFAHIDVDWYDPVKTSLERIVPRLPVGGIVILDDYFDWGSCRRAVDEYFSAIADRFAMDGRFGSMMVTRLY